MIMDEAKGPAVGEMVMYNFIDNIFKLNERLFNNQKHKYERYNIIYCIRNI
jgi:hypothetical protein